MFFYSCSNTPNKQSISAVLDQWHLAAASADYEAYFGFMSKQSVFLGTDASENWQREAFESFSKPYFDSGKAWSFSAVERNIYFSEDGKLAWFDELLDTQMELCRGSGVLIIENEKWKVAHYVLSIAVPNEQVSEVVRSKKEHDSLLKIQFLQNKL